MKAAQVTTVSLALAGVLYLLIIGIILKRGDSRRGAVGMLLAYVMISLLWTLAQLSAQLGWPPFFTGALAGRVLLYGLLLLSLLFFGLTRLFLQLEGTGWVWWLLGGIWLAVAVVISEELLVLLRVSWLSGIQYRELGFAVSICGWGGFMGGTALLAARTFRHILQPLHRNRFLYWLLAFGFTVAGAALFLAGQKLLAGDFHLLGVLSVAYVVLSYRLLDMRQMTRQMLSYLVMTLLAVAIYVGCFLLAQRFFGSLAGYTPLVAGAVVAWALAIAFNPLLRWVQRLVNRLTVGISYDTGQTLREYSARISSILELESLAEAVMGLIGETMDVRRGALFTVHEEGDGQESHFRLQSVKGMGQELRPVVLSADSPIAKYLMREHHPITQYDIDLLPHFQDTLPEERAWFTGLDMDVCVPICGKGQWIGMLALGRKASGDRYFGDDLALLSMLADQTAVALENARLFDDLRMRNVENKRLNQQLTTANVELSRLGQAKSDFIDIASHELRTPLTQVCGYNDMLGEMIQEGTLTIEMGAQMTERVRNATVRLEKIVTTMLDVSMIDTETLDLHVSSVSIASIISRIESAWSHALDERKQVLAVTGLNDLPSVRADDERLEQVFSCLVQNAIKYTPDGGHIQISGGLLGDPQELTVEVVVADTGIGIVREDLGRIFEKFYRVGDVLAHSTGETKFKGAGPGLGLTIAQGIMEAHGGHIWAESPGQDEEAFPGTKFHVLLPVQSRRVELSGLKVAGDCEG